nr:GTP-binding protein [Ciceribacter naphthalenivorans]
MGHRLHTWPDDDRSTRVVLIGQDMPQKPIRDLFDVLAPRASRRRSAPA